MDKTFLFWEPAWNIFIDSNVRAILSKYSGQTKDMIRVNLKHNHDYGLT